MCSTYELREPPPPATHALPVTRYPSPATRHPLPVTHHPRKIPADCAHLDALIGAINNCGVCFQVWEKKDADGKRSGTYDFTSLMGNDKKLLLKHLHEKLPGVIKSDASASVIKIWKVLCSNTSFT
jgi:hypothetical protein